jgi:hypothetical protein
MCVGVVGIFTWFAVLVAGSASVKPSVDFEEPFAMILGPPIYTVLANICFTAGWIIDEIFYKGSPRSRLLQAGFGSPSVSHRSLDFGQSSAGFVPSQQGGYSTSKLNDQCP